MDTSKKNNRVNPWLFLVPLLFFTVGAGIFLYPAVSNYLAEVKQRDVITSYESKISESSQEELDRLWEEAETYNENLAGDPVHDPFIMGSGYVLPDNYGEVLNVDGDGVMGYIEIPKIDVYLPIYHGTDEETLEKGAGHVEATALPIGGNNRHPVISAHRGLPSAELFTRLDEIEEGDEFYIHILNEVLAYQVDKITVIEPEELQALVPEEDKDLVTLLTCTPYAVNSHRLLVRGQRIPYEEETQSQGPVIKQNPWGSWVQEYKNAVILGVAVLTVLTIGIIVLRKRKKKRR